MADPISGLAAMMAGGGGMPMPGGMPMGGEMEDMGGEEMVPCPVCMGTGMVTEDIAESMGGGMGGLPPNLAMRMPPQLSNYPAPPMTGGQYIPPMTTGV